MIICSTVIGSIIGIILGFMLIFVINKQVPNIEELIWVGLGEILGIGLTIIIYYISYKIYDKKEI